MKTDKSLVGKGKKVENLGTFFLAHVPRKEREELSFLSALSSFLRCLSFCGLSLYALQRVLDKFSTRTQQVLNKFSIYLATDRPLRGDKKTAGGLLPPPTTTETLRFDVFLFPRVLGKYPLATFGLGNDNLAIGVLAVFALVVIP